jgi:hypothetical protein
MKNKTESERFFSVELKSKTHLKNVTLTNGTADNALIEGTLGELVEATIAEDIVLEVVGTKGTLRINLARNEIMEARKQ